MTKFDVVNKASHYNVHPSGVEAILIVRHLSFDLGNAFKYVFRYKGKEAERSLRSAQYYFNDHVNQDLPQITDRQWASIQPLIKRVIDSERDMIVSEFYSKFSEYLYSNNDPEPVRAVLKKLIDRETNSGN